MHSLTREENLWEYTILMPCRVGTDREYNINHGYLLSILDAAACKHIPPVISNFDTGSGFSSFWSSSAWPWSSSSLPISAPGNEIFSFWARLCRILTYAGCSQSGCIFFLPSDAFYVVLQHTFYGVCFRDLGGVLYIPVAYLQVLFFIYFSPSELWPADFLPVCFKVQVSAHVVFYFNRTTSRCQYRNIYIYIFIYIHNKKIRSFLENITTCKHKMIMSTYCTL